MSKRIYWTPSDGEEVCEIGPDLLDDADPDDCAEEADFTVQDTETGKTWLLCTIHKDAVKAAGVAW